MSTDKCATAAYACSSALMCRVRMCTLRGVCVGEREAICIYLSPGGCSPRIIIITAPVYYYARTPVGRRRSFLTCIRRRVLTCPSHRPRRRYIIAFSPFPYYFVSRRFVFLLLAARCFCINACRHYEATELSGPGIFEKKYIYIPPFTRYV